MNLIRLSQERVEKEIWRENALLLFGLGVISIGKTFFQKADGVIPM